VDVFRSPELTLQAGRERNAAGIQKEKIQQAGFDRRDRDKGTPLGDPLKSNATDWATESEEIRKLASMDENTTRDENVKRQIRRARLLMPKLDEYLKVDQEQIRLGKSPLNLGRSREYLYQGTDLNKKTQSPAVPTFDEFKATARKNKSKLTDQQLDAYYRQNYGR